MKTTKALQKGRPNKPEPVTITVRNPRDIRLLHRAAKALSKPLDYTARRELRMGCLETILGAAAKKGGQPA